jgi:hypothetical protein
MEGWRKFIAASRFSLTFNLQATDYQAIYK